jgi:hypothetical protein
LPLSSLFFYLFSFNGYCIISYRDFDIFIIPAGKLRADDKILVAFFYIDGRRKGASERGATSNPEKKSSNKLFI